MTTPPPTVTLPEYPGVTFTMLTGSGGVPGLPSNAIRIVGTVVNPWYEPGYNYGQDPNGFTEITDPWKRHTEQIEVTNTGFLAPTAPVPTEPPPAPPAPTPDPEPTPEEV
ncbi:hypothetical protein BOWSER_28 [Gordonia phage Bowser]|uniref:Uncharacterized protein n=1 Tax=Gordonia phage Bowser TaxID=1838063 RepID=A0A166Y356_9CAUD|nr:hypothetical protein BH770_gp28 [Gordonia phage Bowser]ANA85423.1 hypothetical protein BOWSER_28 [Gordonia phage Bowser]